MWSIFSTCDAFQRTFMLQEYEFQSLSIRNESLRAYYRFWIDDDLIMHKINRRNGKKMHFVCPGISSVD